MIRLACALMLLALSWTASAIDEEGPLEDPELQARYERFTNELRCLVCQNQTVADSNADLAADLRNQTRQMLLDGATDEQIVAYMTDRYGDFVLYRPPLTPKTWLLWGAPGILLLGGVLGAALVIRRRSRAEDLPAEGEEVIALSGEERDT